MMVAEIRKQELNLDMSKVDNPNLDNWDIQNNIKKSVDQKNVDTHSLLRVNRSPCMEIIEHLKWYMTAIKIVHFQV